ncbi:retrovirus-related pol polyprotein from transposon TNT 1-94 [Tanacetum coccineum]|uniref:Retrovirus-related pol polyprotein from transposon TNT 1-94 n=1 Tax=Tanacetum coccineum TaxID=301880 RepID=A0ABQ5J932_9ASTR
MVGGNVKNAGNQVVHNAVQKPGIQNVRNQNRLIVVLGIANQNANQNGDGNVVAARAEGNGNRNNGNQIRCYNCRGLGHYVMNCIVRPRRRDAANLQTQLLIAQKEEAGIQLQAEEFDLMADAGDIDEIEEVNANCILMANLQQASTSGTQTDKAPIYDSERSAENHSLIHQRLDKTSYELINNRKPDISFLHVFGAICYPKNDHKDIGKLGAKCDIGFFIGYSATSCTYRVYNQRTRKIMETMNVTFDKLSAMAFEQRSSKPELEGMTSRHISSGLELTYAPSTISSQKLTKRKLDLLFEAMYDDYC